MLKKSIMLMIISYHFIAYNILFSKPAKQQAQGREHLDSNSAGHINRSTVGIVIHGRLVIQERASLPFERDRREQIELTLADRYEMLGAIPRTFATFDPRTDTIIDGAARRAQTPRTTLYDILRNNDHARSQTTRQTGHDYRAHTPTDTDPSAQPRE